MKNKKTDTIKHTERPLQNYEGKNEDYGYVEIDTELALAAIKEVKDEEKRKKNKQIKKKKKLNTVTIKKR